MPHLASWIAVILLVTEGCHGREPASPPRAIEVVKPVEPVNRVAGGDVAREESVDPNAAERCRANDRLACIAAARGRAAVEARGFLAKACDLGPVDYQLAVASGKPLSWEATVPFWEGCAKLGPLTDEAMNAAIAAGSTKGELASPVLCGQTPITFVRATVTLTMTYPPCSAEARIAH